MPTWTELHSFFCCFRPASVRCDPRQPFCFYPAFLTSFLRRSSRWWGGATRSSHPPASRTQPSTLDTCWSLCVLYCNCTVMVPRLHCHVLPSFTTHVLHYCTAFVSHMSCLRHSRPARMETLYCLDLSRTGINPHAVNARLCFNRTDCTADCTVRALAALHIFVLPVRAGGACRARQCGPSGTRRQPWLCANLFSLCLQAAGPHPGGAAAWHVMCFVFLSLPACQLGS